MKVNPIKTHKITSNDTDILSIIDQYITTMEDNSVLAITSKIVAIAQGRLVKIEEAEKDQLIEGEAQYYLPRNENKYNVSLTITNNTLIASAGIDESNANGYYILWPENPIEVANRIREHLKKKFHVNNLGVIITDSKTTPLRWGVTAIAIGFSGIKPLKNYIGVPDIFGKNLEYTKMNIVDNLASSAAVVMGEGGEQTPFALIQDPPVEFVDRNPTTEEIAGLQIPLEEDLYAPLLKSVAWKKGKA